MNAIAPAVPQPLPELPPQDMHGLFRLFIKLYGLLIATIIGSFFIQQQMVSYAVRHSQEMPRSERFRGTFHLIEDRLKALPAARWQAEMDAIRTGFSTPVKLLPLGDLLGDSSWPASKRDALAAGELVSLDMEGGGARLYKRVPDSNSVTHLELPGYPSLSMKIDLINWGCEFTLVGLLIFFWARPFWRDLLNLRTAAERVGEGQFNTMVRMRRGSPLYYFSLCFNTMTQRIATLIESHKSLTNAVSHELRTPLARLRFSHALAMGGRDMAEKDHYLATMERDISELDDLAAEMLTYARLDRERPDLTIEQRDAAPWLARIVEDAAITANAMQREVELESSVGLARIDCEPRFMARAVSNLLRNALRAAKRRVRVSIEQEAGKSVIHVDDDGEGIPNAERQRVFQPFMRLDRSRDRASGGTGLGLAIVRQIARWHGGEAVISDSPLGGARVTIRW